MAQPYVGEIRMFAGNFAPVGWSMCEGQTIPIAENEVLFQLIGTTYGGDGEETFMLPDLRGRIPIHQGTGPGATHVLGEVAGVEEVTLSVPQIPTHTHPLYATLNPAATTTPSAASAPALTQIATITAYGSDAPTAPLHPSALASVGGSQPHTNFQPYLCVNFIISMFGLYPSQT